MNLYDTLHSLTLRGITELRTPRIPTNSNDFPRHGGIQFGIHGIQEIRRVMTGNNASHSKMLLLKAAL